MEIKNCIRCNKKFIKRQTESSSYWKTRRFCSKSCSLFGRPGYWKGKKLSKKTLEKLSKARKGKPGWSKGLTKYTNSSVRILGIKSGLSRLNKPKKEFRIINGYKNIFKPEHPRANRFHKCVPEQVLIMEKHINRFLKKEEEVHHINLNKIDNRIQNLMLFKNKAEHMRFHCKFCPNHGIKKRHQGGHIVTQETKNKISNTLKKRHSRSDFSINI